VGEIELHLKDTPLALRTNEFEKVVLADQFQVRGLSVRNRGAGVGVPLICVESAEGEFGVRFSEPATAFLRVPGSLAEIAAGTGAGSLELYSADDSSVAIGGAAIGLSYAIVSAIAIASSWSCVT
jgi:hypothetical protein